MMMRKHTHWREIKGSMVNSPHFVCLKHKDVYSLNNHNILTGTFKRWYKKTLPSDYKRLHGHIVDKITNAYKDHLKNKLSKK